MKGKKFKYIRKIFLWGLLAYVAVAAVIGTYVMAWPFIVLGYNGLIAPAPMPVYLPNGFVYESDWDSPQHDYIIKDKDEQKIVIGDVIGVMWHGTSVYGFRLGLSNEPYYFVCTYGKDCKNDQHLREAEFIQMLKDKDLPAYTASKARTYEQLLWIQSKHYKGYGG